MSILGVWPRGVDARVEDGGRAWPVRHRRGLGWQCMCGVPACAHLLAVALVVAPRT